MEEVINLMCSQLELNPEDIKPESEIRELTEDSLDLIELVLAVEDKFRIDIPDEDLNQIITVQHLADYVEKTSSQCGEV
jgi:acyl carrier protein